jgi:hypothetical protein
MSHTLVTTTSLIYYRWCPVNDEGSRFFVADVYGRLALLSLEPTAERTLGVIPLGEVGLHLNFPNRGAPSLFIIRFLRPPLYVILILKFCSLVRISAIANLLKYIPHLYLISAPQHSQSLLMYQLFSLTRFLRAIKGRDVHG